MLATREDAEWGITQAEVDAQKDREDDYMDLLNLDLMEERAITKAKEDEKNLV